MPTTMQTTYAQSLGKSLRIFATRHQDCAAVARYSVDSLCSLVLALNTAAAEGQVTPKHCKTGSKKPPQMKVRASEQAHSAMMA